MARAKVKAQQECWNWLSRSAPYDSLIAYGKSEGARGQFCSWLIHEPDIAVLESNDGLTLWVPLLACPAARLHSEKAFENHYNFRPLIPVIPEQTEIRKELGPGFRQDEGSVPFRQNFREML